jgi:hypothetical protein
MKMTQKAFYIIFRILVSCFTAGYLVLFFSLLAGEDLIHNKEKIFKIEGLQKRIGQQLNGNIEQQVTNPGEIPEKNPLRKLYCIQLAKVIHNAFQFIQKQRIMFNADNSHTYQNQFKRVMSFAESSNVQRLMDELNMVKKELANSADLLEQQRTRLVHQRGIYFVLFFVLWVVLYMYFSRGILYRTQRRFEA